MTDYTPAQARKFANNIECEWGWPNEDSRLLRSLADQIDALTAERDAIKQQAQIWKMEAETQKATVHEIYQLCTGATGEPGDWHGAEPVRALVANAARWRYLMSENDIDGYITGAGGAYWERGAASRVQIEAAIDFLADAAPVVPAPVVQLSEPPDPFTDGEMACAAWALLGAAKGTKQAKAFNVGARWARSHLPSASTIPKE